MNPVFIGPFRIYPWSNCFGWHLVGFGYKARWFLGFSIAAPKTTVEL